jgi:hypothetical protein
LSAIEILLLGAAAEMQKGLPKGQARHATRSMRRTKMFPSGAVVTATGRTIELIAPAVFSGF